MCTCAPPSWTVCLFLLFLSPFPSFLVSSFLLLWLSISSSFLFPLLLQAVISVWSCDQLLASETPRELLALRGHSDYGWRSVMTGGDGMQFQMVTRDARGLCCTTLSADANMALAYNSAMPTRSASARGSGSGSGGGGTGSTVATATSASGSGFGFGPGVAGLSGGGAAGGAFGASDVAFNRTAASLGVTRLPPSGAGSASSGAKGVPERATAAGSGSMSGNAAKSDVTSGGSMLSSEGDDGRPQGLAQEFHRVRRLTLPNLHVAKVDAAARQCDFSIVLQSDGGAKVVVKFSVVFPIYYPEGIAPTFHLLPSTPLRANLKQQLLEVSGDLSHAVE